MAELQIYEKAFGNCIACGEDSKHSMYWTPLSDKYWEMLRPSLQQNIYFIPPLTKPFCGPKCATEYHKEKTNG